MSRQAATLLIATEHRPLAETLFHRLRSPEVQVKLAYDPRTAMLRAIDCRPDFLAIDAALTGFDGWNLAELLLLDPLLPTDRIAVLLPDGRHDSRGGQSPDGCRFVRIDRHAGEHLARLLEGWRRKIDVPQTSQRIRKIGASSPAATPPRLISHARGYLGTIPPLGRPRQAAPRPLLGVNRPPAIPRRQDGTQQPRDSR